MVMRIRPTLRISSVIRSREVCISSLQPWIRVEINFLTCVKPNWNQAFAVISILSGRLQRNKLLGCHRAQIKRQISWSFSSSTPQVLYSNVSHQYEKINDNKFYFKRYNEILTSTFSQEENFIPTQNRGRKLTHAVILSISIISPTV